MTVLRRAVPLAVLLGGLCVGQPRRPDVNYDESKVPPYTLPDPFVCADGTRVTTAALWRKKRRPEVLRLFESEVYGRSPGRPRHLDFETVSVERGALGGKRSASWLRCVSLQDARIPRCAFSSTCLRPRVGLYPFSSD